MKKLFALLACLLMLCPCVLAEDAAAPVLEIHQMALGYADGYYLRCGDVEIMIDGGNPNPGGVNDDVMNYLRDVGAQKLDVHIITHWHLDHCEKLNEILAAFGTENTVVYSPSETLPNIVMNEEKEFPIAPLANGVYKQMVMGDVLEIGGMTITCIGPRTLAQNGRCNSDSLNFVVQYGERRILFTGDYAQSGPINKEFKELCADVDVLKFPHHGGKPYEIGDIAARNASPEYVLLPSKLNGYPIYNFLRDRGVKIDQDKIYSNIHGHVVLLTDGDSIEVRTEVNPADFAPKAN